MTIVNTKIENAFNGMFRFFPAVKGSPARTASLLVISHAVYDIVRNECIYWGDIDSCQELEFTSDRFLAISL